MSDEATPTPGATATITDAGGTTLAVTAPPEHDCEDRRDFQWIVGGALAGCMAIQAILMWKLMGASPPDSSWDLIKTMMGHLGQVDILLIGGLLGRMTGQKR